MRIHRTFLLVVVLLLSLVAVSTTLAGTGPKTTKGKYKVGANRLYLACAGSGKPTVVLDAGLGNGHSFAWEPVASMSRTLKTRVCGYDRASTGESTGWNGKTRTIGRTAADLHTLLKVAKLRGPFVIAGHSMGGLVDREFARRYPKDVAGLVLFDTAPDDWDLYTGTRVFEEGERLDVAAASAALRARDNVGAKPVVVVKAGDPSTVAAYWAPDKEDFDYYWDSAQRKLATISSNSIFVIATGISHQIPILARDLTRESIRLVVVAARKKAKLPACAATRLPQLNGSCDAAPVPPPAPS